VVQFAATPRPGGLSISALRAVGKTLGCFAQVVNNGPQPAFALIGDLRYIDKVLSDRKGPMTTRVVSWENLDLSRSIICKKSLSCITMDYEIGEFSAGVVRLQNNQGK